MKMNKQTGFTLIELMLTVAIVGILAGIAIPSYGQYIVRGSRAAVQTELLQLASLQEKIYLNSNSYTTAASSVTAAYTGQATGGLGWSAQSKDTKYDISCTCAADSFTVMATPVATKGQAGDGTLSITSQGKRIWTGAKPTW
jgi:type IV pilus assembly protein PilE